jgi:hypothetical protein
VIFSGCRILADQIRKDKIMELKPGDVVTLKSGGHPLPAFILVNA